MLFKRKLKPEQAICTIHKNYINQLYIQIYFTTIKYTWVNDDDEMPCKQTPLCNEQISKKNTIFSTNISKSNRSVTRVPARNAFLRILLDNDRNVDSLTTPYFHIFNAYILEYIDVDIVVFYFVNAKSNRVVKHSIVGKYRHVWLINIH